MVSADLERMVSDLGRVLRWRRLKWPSVLGYRLSQAATKWKEVDRFKSMSTEEVEIDPLWQREH
jgi:hypothetical protein